MLVLVIYAYARNLPLRLRGHELGYLLRAWTNCATSSPRACQWARRC
jgi:hypothetical protein